MPEERGISNASSLLTELESITRSTTQISQKQCQGPKVLLITAKKGDYEHEKLIIKAQKSGLGTERVSTEIKSGESFGCRDKNVSTSLACFCRDRERRQGLFLPGLLLSSVM